MNKALNQYLATALWSSIDDNDEPMDANFSIDDFSSEAITKAKQDWEAFLDKVESAPFNLNGQFIDSVDLTDVAHDFWLTRNRHGAGFWDGDYDKKIGKYLTELAHSFGETVLYIGDDGKLYFSR